MLNHSNNSRASDRRTAITYWISTSLLIFELLYGATWDFNLLNQGFVAGVMAHLGYPPYLPSILGVSKILAAICIGMPNLNLIKEWAYSGIMILFLGAVFSHIVTGNDLSSLIFLFVCIGLTIISYCFRPNSRRLI